MRSRLILLVLSAVLAGALPSGASSPRIGATRLFTRVPSPGNPEGIAVDHQGTRVYVGTHTTIYGNAGSGPSKLFVYDAATGAALEEVEIAGQDLDQTHGLVGLAPGKQDTVFVTDRAPARVLRIEFTKNGPVQTTYASLPDLAPCTTGATPCSDTIGDLPSFPDGVVFDHAGNLYVSDFQQATIFKVPPGGGDAQVWFTDSRLESPFGPNGLAIDKSKDTLYFAMTGAALPPLTTRGAIYTLPLQDSVDEAQLREFFVYADPAAGPDGIAFGDSGKLYVALAGANAISVLSPDGQEVARFPGAVENQQQEVPYDMPASIAFNDRTRSIFVTQHTYFTGNSEHWAVLEAFVDDTAAKLEEPN